MTTYPSVGEQVATLDDSLFIPGLQRNQGIIKRRFVFAIETPLLLRSTGCLIRRRRIRIWPLEARGSDPDIGSEIRDSALRLGRLASKNTFPMER